MADLTLTVIAERLGCKPDAKSICEAIEKLKRKVRSPTSQRPADNRGEK